MPPSVHLILFVLIFCLLLKVVRTVPFVHRVAQCTQCVLHTTFVRLFSRFTRIIISKILESLPSEASSNSLA